MNDESDHTYENIEDSVKSVIVESIENINLIWFGETEQDVPPFKFGGNLLANRILARADFKMDHLRISKKN